MVSPQGEAHSVGKTHWEGNFSETAEAPFILITIKKWKMCYNNELFKKHMALPKKVENYLKKTNRVFERVTHKTVYTAFDLAKTLGEDLKRVAKALLVKADREYLLVVLPSNTKLNFQKLKKVLGAKKVILPDEKTMSQLFKVNPGAITAFGKLHKVRTVVDRGLLKVKEAIFQAGSFTDSIRMKVKDFIEIEEAGLGNFAQTARYTLSKTSSKKPSQKKTASEGRGVQSKRRKNSNRLVRSR